MHAAFCYNILMEKYDMKALIDCAAGRVPADLVLRGGRIFNVFTGETEEGDVAVKDGYIAGIGTGYTAQKVYDLSGKVLLPGFIDSHIHIESTMLTPEEMARLAVPHGTSAIVADPHELVNVCGVQGAEYILGACERMGADGVSPAGRALTAPPRARSLQSPNFSAWAR